MAVRHLLRRVMYLATTASIAAASVPSLSHAQPVVSTVPAWDGATAVPLLSRDFLSASVGQTFTTPVGASALSGFTLFMGYNPSFFPDDQDVQFHAYLFGWNGRSLTDLLWKSPLESGATGVDLEARAFTVGGVPLSAGGQYAIVLSTMEADPFDPAGAFVTSFPAFQNIGLVDADAYLGGTLIESSADSWESLLATPWLASASADLAFEMRFASPTIGVPVPEPSTRSLLVLLAMLLSARTVVRRASRCATR